MGLEMFQNFSKGVQQNETRRGMCQAAAISPTRQI